MLKSCAMSPPECSIRTPMYKHGGFLYFTNLRRPRNFRHSWQIGSDTNDSDVVVITKSQIVQMLQASGSSQEALFREARLLRSSAWGDTVILRGVIEITNICRVDCEYCPMRRSNQPNLRTFLAGSEHIIAAAKEIKKHGIDIVFIQGGETAKILVVCFIAPWSFPVFPQ